APRPAPGACLGAACNQSRNLAGARRARSLVASGVAARRARGAAFSARAVRRAGRLRAAAVRRDVRRRPRGGFLRRPRLLHARGARGARGEAALSRLLAELRAALSVRGRGTAVAVVERQSLRTVRDRAERGCALVLARERARVLRGGARTAQLAAVCD